MKLKSQYIKLNSSSRLYQLEVPVIGLTGGIATGKSTVSRIIKAEGIPLIDADQLVKDVYAEKETCDFIKTHHPDAWKNNAVHFPTLREKFFKDSNVKEEIENFIYSRLPDAFMNAFKKLGNPPFVVYDVPLLFEKQLQTRVDLTVLVYASRSIQTARIIDRDGHKEEMAQTIMNHQMDIDDKKQKADFIIDNCSGKEELAVEVKSFLRQAFN